MYCAIILGIRTIVLHCLCLRLVSTLIKAAYFHNICGAFKDTLNSNVYSLCSLMSFPRVSKARVRKLKPLMSFGVPISFQAHLSVFCIAIFLFSLITGYNSNRTACTLHARAKKCFSLCFVKYSPHGRRVWSRGCTSDTGCGPCCMSCFCFYVGPLVRMSRNLVLALL